MQNNYNKAIHGAKGKGGGGNTFREDENTLQSNATIRVVEVLSEGQIKGPVEGAKGIFINDTPLQNSDGSYNFGGRVQWDWRAGLPSQPYMPGFPSANSEIDVSTEVTNASAVSHTSVDSDIDAMRVTVGLNNGLVQQNTENNSVVGTSVELAIDKKSTASGTWVADSQFTISGKTTSPYEQGVIVQRPAGTTGSWDVRLRRVTADNASSTLRNNTYFNRVTEIRNAQLEYEDTAYVGIAIDADTVGSSSVPTRAYLIDGIICKVPDNYDPETREYTGVWDGATWKMAWTDNPAWILYDLIGHPRYGLGQYVTENYIDQYSFYDAAVYNDELLTYTDENGDEQEAPRFTFNYVIPNRTEALTHIQNVAGSMRGKVVWVGGLVTLIQDRPSDPVLNVTNSNIVGHFRRSSSPLSERFTAVNVTWNDPGDRYLQKITTVEADAEYIDRYGYNVAEFAAYGCTNEGQAVRAGKWYLDSVLTQLQILRFKQSYEAFQNVPGDVIRVFDAHYAGIKHEGRLLTGNTTTVLNLDCPVLLGADSVIHLTLPDGTVVTKEIVEAGGTVSTLTLNEATDEPLPEYTNWIVQSTVDPQLFRITKITQAEPNVIDVEATLYDPDKYARIEEGAEVTPRTFSALETRLISAPRNIDFVEVSVNEDNTLRRTLLTSWERPTTGFPVKYRGRWQLDSGVWTIFEVTSNSFEIANALPGTYRVQVTAISYGDIVSSPLTGSYSLSVAGEEASPLNEPTDLEEANTGSTSVFAGRDLNVRWTNPSSNATVLNATLRDFELMVIDPADDSVLRVEYIQAVGNGQDQFYSYTYAKNNADNNNVPIRAIKIEVRARDANNSLTDEISHTFTNPAPSTVSSLSVTGGIGNIKVSYAYPTDPDVRGFLVWMSTSNGFTPGSGNLVYDGGDTYTSFNVTPGTTYYFKVAAYDDFGKHSSGTGLNVSSQQSAASIATAGIPSGSSNPVSGSEGDLFYNTTDGKLYRYHSSAWTAAVPSTDVTGTLTDAQLAAISAAKITGQITTTQITDNSISTAKLQAGSVTTNEIAANTIVAGDIAAGTITTTQIAASTITGSNIAGTTITGSNIAANTITAGKIQASTITTNEIASNTIVAGNIAANTITAAKIASATITTNEIASNTIVAGNIAANTITAAKIAAGTITGTEIAATTITASNIAASTITAAKMAAGTITAASGILADAVITTAKIDDLQVSTIKIASGAVSTMYSSSSTGSSTNVSVTIPSGARGLAVMGFFSADVKSVYGGTGEGGVPLYTTGPAFGTVSASSVFSSNTGFAAAAFSYTNPTAGSYTFTATRTGSGSFQGNITIVVIVTNR